MFALLISLTAVEFAPVPSLIDHWKDPSPAVKPQDPYDIVMSRNAADGFAFSKPMRGHEDGCVAGKCMETATALGNDGVLTTPMHIPVHAHRAY